MLRDKLLWDAGLNTLPQSSSSSRLHPGMIQRSDRETRVLIVEGINTDKREEDYSRKFQVCSKLIQQSLHEQVLIIDVTNHSTTGKLS